MAFTSDDVPGGSASDEKTTPARSSGQDERITIRITPATRAVIEAIKRDFGYRTDADVIRHALGTQVRIGESVRNRERIFVGSESGELLKELVFVGPS